MTEDELRQITAKTEDEPGLKERKGRCRERRRGGHVYMSYDQIVRGGVVYDVFAVPYGSLEADDLFSYDPALARNRYTSPRLQPTRIKTEDGWKSLDPTNTPRGARSIKDQELMVLYVPLSRFF